MSHTLTLACIKQHDSYGLSGISR